MSHRVDFLKDGITKLFMKFLIPSISGSVMVSMYILFDTIFVGREVGSEGLAALNMATPIYNVLFAAGLLMGAVTNIVLDAVFIFIFNWGMRGAAIATGFLFPKPIVSLFNSDNTELMRITVRGISIYFIGFIIMGLNISLGAFYQAIEYSIFSMIISICRGSSRTSD
jgi:Na+-driven multidrug efflux pump